MTQNTTQRPIIIFTIIALLAYTIYYYGNKSEEIDPEEYPVTQNEIERSTYIDETNVTLLTDSNSLEEGKDIFRMYCMACHGSEAQGTKVAPNLTDEYWVYGDGIKDLFWVTKEGIPKNGMISWETILTPIQMQQVNSYILSLQGTNPPNALPPEGEKYISK